MYRTVDCATWDDLWFVELGPHAKLLFFYCMTNRRSTACGVYEITIRAMAFETGLSPADVTAALAELAPKVVYWPEHQTLWVRNFYRHQRANSNEKFTASARKALAQFASVVQAAVGDAYADLLLIPPTPAPLPPTGIPLISHTNGIAMGYESQGGKEEETVTATVEQKQEQNRETVARPAPVGAAAPPVPPLRAVPKRKTAPSVPGWDYKALWAARQEAFGYPLPKSQYAPETQAVNEILADYPDVTPDDLTAFLVYRRTCFGVDPASAILLHRHKPHFGPWWAAGCPTAQVQNGGTHAPDPASKNGAHHAAPQRQPDSLTRKLNGTAELFADIDAGTLQGVDRPRGPNVSLLRSRAVS